MSIEQNRALEVHGTFTEPHATWQAMNGAHAEGQGSHTGGAQYLHWRGTVFALEGMVLTLEGTVLTWDLMAVARHGMAMHGCATAFSFCPFNKFKSFALWKLLVTGTYASRFFECYSNYLHWEQL
jgi:hypothetical protein